MKLTNLIPALLLVFSSQLAQSAECAQVFASDLRIMTRNPVVQSRVLAVPGSAGGNVKVEYSLPEKGKPTFLFLPGSIRALGKQDEFIKVLGQQGIGWVALNFSRHPLSIVETPNHVETVQRDYTFQNLRQEVQLVRDFVTRELRIPNAIPVTFSFSGILAPLFAGERLLFEMVPMTSMDAATPALSSLRSSLQAGAILNPLFGPQIMRQTLDSAYRNAWSGRVNDMVRKGELPEEFADSAIEGYVSLVRSAESLDLVAQDRMKSSGVRRAFLLAQGEGPELLQHQIERFNQIQKVEPASLLVLVENVGHLMMLEQPKFLAELMPVVLGRLQEGRGGVMVIDPFTGAVKNTLP